MPSSPVGYTAGAAAEATGFCTKILVTARTIGYNAPGTGQGFMNEQGQSRSRFVVGNRFAVVVIAVLFAASAAGWILTELVPPDVPFAREAYVERWGEGAVRAVLALRLHDPFHSPWYRGVLGLFLATMVLCLATRWPDLLRRSFRVEAPAVPFAGPPRLSVPWEEEGQDGVDVVEHHRRRYGRPPRLDGERLRRAARRATTRLRSTGWRVATGTDGESVLFSARAGGLRTVGTLLFHVGLVVVSAGAIATSLLGKTEYLEGRPGDLLSLADEEHGILVRDFEILRGPDGELRDYISVLSLIGPGGDTLGTETVEVNKPLSVGSWDIFQSYWEVEPEVFESAVVRWRRGSAPPVAIRLRPGEEVRRGGFVLRARRFLPDFRIGPRGAWSASGTPANPALEVELADSAGAQRGWLFLRHPSANSRFDGPVGLALLEIEPVYVTGLQASRDPGGTPVIAGAVIATIGLGLMYTKTRRFLQGAVTPEALVIGRAAGFGDRALRREVDRLVSGIAGGGSPGERKGTER